MLQYWRASSSQRAALAGSELKLVISLVRPKYFIPVHGEYRHLVKHKQLALQMGVKEDRCLVVENGARVFASEREIERFVGAGGRLEARVPIRVAGVALNPYSPEGFWLPADEMRERLEALVPDLPVFDAIRD